MRSRALILEKFRSPLRSEYIDVPEPGDDESVLIRVSGAGMCKSDVGLWRGDFAEGGRPSRLPFVLGHENAGIIEKVGKKVVNFNVGDKVLVYAIWADCKYCRVGKCMQCRNQSIPGQINYYGGYAEYLYVPSYRFLVKIDIDPVIAAPLADAGLTSYSAIKKVLPYLYPGSSVIVYGVGGLASYAIQFLRYMAPYSTIIASSRSDEKLKWAKELGAHYAVHPNELESLVRSTTDEGVSAIIDLVGTEETARTLARLLEPGGVIVLVGMEGKEYPMPVFETTVWQYTMIGSNYGTINEMEEMVKLVRDKGIKSYIKTIPLDEKAVNEALNTLAEGKILGRFVITP